MKKLIKAFSILLAFLLILVIGGTLALRIYLPPEKVKAMVLQHLSAQLKREVSLGAVSVSLFSGLKMTDLKISEAPDFSKGTFVSSQNFSLKLALLPLLKRQMIVSQVVLQRPEVQVVRLADGKTYNFSDLLSTATVAASTASVPTAEAPPEESHYAFVATAYAAGPPPAGGASPPFQLVVSNGQIRNGIVHFIDRSPARQSMDIAPIELKVKNVSLTDPFSYQVSFHVKSKGGELAVVSAGTVNIENGSAKINQGSLSAKKSQITFSGDLLRLKTPDPAVDVKIDIPQLFLGDLAPFVVLPPTVKIDKPLKGTASVKGNQKRTDLQARLSLASLQLDTHCLVLNASAAQPVISFHAETNAFPIEEILGLIPSAVPAGTSLKGMTKLSVDLSGTQAASQAAVTWVGTDVAIVQGDTFIKPAGTLLQMTLNADIVDTEPLKVLIKNMVVKLASNQMTGSGTYESRGTKTVVDFKAKGSQWSVKELAALSPLLAPYHPTGTLSFDVHAVGPTDALQTRIQSTADVAMANVKHEFYEGRDLALKWNLTEITQDLAKVSGTASLKQGPGKILNVEKLAAGSRIGKIVLSPLETLAKLQQKGVLREVNLPSLQSIAFDSIVGDYVLRSGVMDIRTFDLAGRDLSVQNRGTVGLAGIQPINLMVVVKLAPGAIGGTMGQILNDAQGRATLKFAATGSVADPKVKLDLQDTGKKAIEQVGEELLKNKDVKGAVKDLQKTFEGIFR